MVVDPCTPSYGGGRGQFVCPANIGKLELVRVRDGILHTILVCLLPPHAPQQRSVWQGCGKQGKTIWSGQPSSGWATALFLLQSFLWGSGNAGGWLVAKLSIGSLALPTTVGRRVSGAGSGPHPLFPALG